jgi:hypothetical protein
MISNGTLQDKTGVMSAMMSGPKALLCLLRVMSAIFATSVTSPVYRRLQMDGGAGAIRRLEPMKR